MRELMQYTWEIGVQHFVEFFEGIKTKVILVDSYDDLTKYFEIMKKDDFLFIDFEYKPSTKSSPTNYISLYQICYSQGVVVIKQNTKKPSDQLRNFLSKESGNKFIGKGINGDLTKLKQTFGDDFSINLEDIEITRLAPKNESLNFDAMVLKYARKPAADFNDKKITLSNWAAPKLSIAQVVYASFDVVALFYCFPNFSPIRTIPFVAAPYKSCFISNSIRTIPMPKFHRPYSMKHSLLS
ncbi:hypothetical protein TRFO_19914 [Tritrichomonas foetus]|uniref:3'-5' exonuclease domain-containing protein n=1 Tax=Tritrichomonas foetus TaxID=1144522 RepID=A0A1J4KHC8_9EUKA|nr:hypothetical protein TRFO_19914 [Tritrichomonas foetus]|eukprot:OHT10769.1 hypothetical protein TRFO_19914 [Tritrichomonas foetus]